MTFLRAAALALSAIIALLLASCIDGREEVWLNADGSGRADLAYDIPATVAKFQGGVPGVEALLDDVLKDFPGATKEVTLESGRLKVRVRLSFASADEISKISTSIAGGKTPKQFEHIAGKFEVSRKLRTVDFTRTVSPGKALPTAFIPPSEFKNRKLMYILHLPVVPAESTADRSENGGLTQVWEQPLAAAIRKPMVIHFKAKIPVPGWLVGLVAGGAVLFLAGLVMWARRKRKA